MGVIMRQWLSAVLAAALCLAAIPPADAKGFGGGAGFHAGAGRAFARPAAVARPAQMPRQTRTLARPYRFGRHGWAFASGAGYGLPWSDGSYDPTDPGQAGMPGEGYPPPPPPPWLYGYGPPHQACFTPRIITIGKPPPKTHLPRIVYGSGAPCDEKGT